MNLRSFPIGLRRSVLAALVAAAAVGVGVGSCSDSRAPADLPKDGGADGTGGAGGIGAGGSSGVGGTAASGGGGSGGSAGSACSGFKAPDDVPEGWVRYPIFDCLYPIYVPPTTAALPKPFEWQDCTETGPDPYTCRELVVDWDTLPGNGIAGGSRGYVDASGKVVLQLRKSYVKPNQNGTPGNMMGVMAVVVEADGPVRQAYWISSQSLSTAPLWFLARGAAGGKSSWSVKEYSPSAGFTRSAAVAGDDTALAQPIVGQWTKEEVAAGVQPGAKYYGLFNGTLSIKSWDGSQDFGTVYAGAMDIGDPIWVGDVAVMDATLISFSHLYSWTPAEGLRKLLHYDYDFSEAAANIATDGVHLVWVHGKDRPAGVDGPYPTTELVMSPFTTDPAKLLPKRVRSYPSGQIWGDQNVVGCGYAAYKFVPQQNDYRILIARLSDGVSWELRSPADNHWTWGQTLAITCDELFITIGLKAGGETIRRVRLDSLGPGLPPD